MAFYQASWLILLSPLFSFAVIIFGTRMWDLATRARVNATSSPEAKAEAEEESDIHMMEVRGAHGEEETLEDDEDPKVPRLTTGARVSAYLGIVIMGLACIYSWLLLLDSTHVINISGYTLPANGIQVLSYDWFTQGTANYIVAFHLDTLAITMMVVVTSVSLLVQFYSQGYMERSAGYARFFSYLSLFTFSMLVITFAQNFLVMFIGWELVGLSSYLLIGFWINKEAKPREDRLSPATAAIEAFITTRVGDVGFMIGIMILFAQTGTFEFGVLASKTDPHGVAQAFAGNSGLLTVAMILVFCGAIGKSAQLPLTVWLPPAMEGPTPVSALIHAATMVAAGVYMVARTFPLFAAAGPAAFQVVAWVGAITAIYAALTALTQRDFKRVLAFSTISQLGYMFVGLGVAGAALGPGPGMFHLFTHAFFKALLFLGAGSVIHALHHATHREVQEMEKMGGLAKFMPITAITWLVATLAISGFPFFSGFYSKDNIIGLAYQHGYYGLYAVTLITAGLTAFYMLRAYILAFGGRDGRVGGLWGGTYRGEGHPHESPLTITIPLVLLAIASIFAGYWTGMFSYIQPGAENLNLGVVFSDPLTWIGVAVSVVGLIWAYVLYTRFELVAIHDFVENNAVLRFLHRLTLRKFYIDDLYTLFIRYVVLGISHIEAAFDTYVVDGIVNGVAQAVTGMGRGVRHVETGRVQSYMAGFFGGVAILAIVVFVLVAFVK
ncbi:MAG TPA: NADH-quinone oxidoreductase subunit L [Ktedonobacteraceae bacterium]|nr:NADH-quinone oxidoreductase subunit L [Ktedonobacteraceae bacterium]